VLDTLSRIYDTCPDHSCVLYFYSRSVINLVFSAFKQYDNYVKWFRSYLSNRKHLVRNFLILSSPHGIRFGVPQGIVLEILDLLYIHK